MQEQRIETVHRSLKRCASNPRFLDIFYENFLGSSPEVRALFADTDMKRQVRAVEASLFMSLLAADRVPYAVSAIKRLGERHSQLGIRRELYGLWLESLIATLRTCDVAFDAPTEAAWREVMQVSISMILAQYESPAWDAEP